MIKGSSKEVATRVAKAMKKINKTVVGELDVPDEDLVKAVAEEYTVSYNLLLAIGDWKGAKYGKQPLEYMDY